jgi:ribosomal protein S8E
MSYLKMVGLGALAALALAAFAGAGTASATALCTEEAAETCPVGKKLKSAKIEGVAENPFLEVSATEKITCKKSVITANVNETGGATGGKITWSECSNTVSGCSGSATTVTTLENRTGSITWTSAGKFNVVTNEPQTAVTMTCFGFKVTCTYKPATITGAGTNGNPANVVINQAIASPGFPCPAGTEKATYKTKVTSGELVGGGAVGAGGLFVTKS